MNMIKRRAQGNQHYFTGDRYVSFGNFNFEKIFSKILSDYFCSRYNNTTDLYVLQVNLFKRNQDRKYWKNFQKLIFSIQFEREPRNQANWL